MITITHDNDNSLPPDNGTDGPTQDKPKAGELISLSDYKQRQLESNKKPLEDPTQWPKIRSQQQQPQATAEPILSRYLVSLESGDIFVDGVIGLSNSFLAVGDTKGNIKFAAAAGKWSYCVDITDDENYKVGYIAQVVEELAKASDDTTPTEES